MWSEEDKSGVGVTDDKTQDKAFTFLGTSCKPYSKRLWVRLGHPVKYPQGHKISPDSVTLKDKSGVGIIVDCSRDSTVVNGVKYFLSFVFPFNLRNYIFQSAEKCEMTSFGMTSLHVDLNEAPKCVDTIPPTLLASLSCIRRLAQNTKWRRYLA